MFGRTRTRSHAAKDDTTVVDLRDGTDERDGEVQRVDDVRRADQMPAVMVVDRPDPAAPFAGMLAAIGATVLLAGVVAGGTTIGFRGGLDPSGRELSAGGFIAGVAVIVISFFTGGWVAGRMSRRRGARHGLMAGLWFLLVLGIVTALGAWVDESYNFLTDVRLPDWFDPVDRGWLAIGTAAALGLVSLVAASAGGAVGARHRQEVAVVPAPTAMDGVPVTASRPVQRERVVERDADRDADRDDDVTRERTVPAHDTEVTSTR
jgi:hypothetical protein